MSRPPLPGRKASPHWRSPFNVLKPRPPRSEPRRARLPVASPADARGSRFWIMSLMNQHTRLDTTPIPFIDVAAQRRRLGSAVDDAIARVLAHCQFVMGPEVQALEKDLAAFCGARHAISCASGTDALLLVLMAKGVGPGDAVFCPAFTFCATGEVVPLLGAPRVFVDIGEPPFNLDVASLKRAFPVAKKGGLTPKAVIPVDLFGLPADHDAVAAVAKAEGLFVLDDAAQSFGAFYQGRHLGTL